MSEKKSPQKASPNGVRPNLSGLPFEQVVEALVKTPAKLLRKASEKPVKKAAKKKTGK